MYHQTFSSLSTPHDTPNLTQPESQANALTPFTWFVNLYILKPPEDTSLPSKLELIFLSDSGTSTSVLNLPTFKILAHHFTKRSNSPPSNTDFKTSTVANKTEVAILFK